MGDEFIPEALLSALDENPGDKLALNTLADWYEERNDFLTAGCVRWLLKHNLQPGHDKNPGRYGPFYWELEGGRRLIEVDDPFAKLPPKLWKTLSDHDEPHEVSSFKSYPTCKLAYLALFKAWRSLKGVISDSPA